MGYGDVTTVLNLGAGTYTGSLSGLIKQIGGTEDGIIYGAEKLLFLIKVSAVSGTNTQVLVDTSIDGVNWTTGGFVGKTAALTAAGNYPLTWVNVPLSWLKFSYSLASTTDSLTLAGIDLLGSNS